MLLIITHNPIILRLNFMRSYKSIAHAKCKWFGLRILFTQEFRGFNFKKIVGFTGEKPYRYLGILNKTVG